MSTDLLRIRLMMDFLKEALALARRKRAEREDLAEKAAVAKAFNDRYTYRHEYRRDCGRFDNFVKRGYAWMCPECNRIHAPIDCSGISGLQYPRCCSAWEGHRLDDGIRT